MMITETLLDQPTILNFDVPILSSEPVSSDEHLSSDVLKGKWLLQKTPIP